MSWKVRAVLWSVFVLAGGLARCVGDAPSNNDGGTPDATSTDTGAPDGGGGDAGSDASTDAALDVNQAPDAVGALGWVRHYGTNYTTNGITFAGNGQFVGVGAYQSQGTKVPIGGLQAPIPAGIDALAYKLDAQGNTLWIKTGSSGGTELFYDVAADANGDLYVSGYASGTSLMLHDTITGPAAFVTKLTADGSTFSWDHSFTSSGNVNSPQVATAGGKVFVAMSYTGTLTYDTSKTFTSTLSASNTSTYDVAVIALNATDGSVVWANSFGGASADSVVDLTTGNQGDPVVGGYFQSDSLAAANAGGSGLPLASPNPGGYAGVVLELDQTNGTSKFALAYGAANAPTSVYAVGSGNGKIVAGGYFQGAVDFGSGSAGSAGAADGFVSVIDEATHTPVLGRTFGGSDNADYVRGVSIDAWGEILAAGYYASTDAVVHSTTGSSPLAANSFGTTGMMEAKWDATGKLLWTKSVVPTQSDGGVPYPITDAGNGYSYFYVEGLGLAVTPSGTSTVAGNMNHGADFGSGYENVISTMTSNGFCQNPFCGARHEPDALMVNYSP